MHPHQQFLQTYRIADPVAFARQYDLDELLLFLPPAPTPAERLALQDLVGVEGVTYGFMDYVKSNHTFELIMQWREKTGNL